MIFVDTGAWIALSDKSDQYHRQAKAIYTRLKRRRARFVTTDYVIDETTTRLRYDSGHASAVKFLEVIRTAEQAGILRVVAITPAVFQTAQTLFRQYDTVVLSLTDCTSFAVCEQHQVSEAFAFDQHFPLRGITLCTK
ncbi:MAG: type II toxin-antitoxin system VapC family toxin [Candidatus Latescibacteria bacterium]|nr:type II toxin-antitoxin system VapC family toxin [Candidatus Latescibacterota bacterium]